MKTTLKSIRFPKVLVDTLEEYSETNFGMSFSKYMIHLSMEKVAEIKKGEQASVLQDMIRSYLDIESQIENGEITPLSTESEVQELLDSWKSDGKI